MLSSSNGKLLSLYSNYLHYCDHFRFVNKHPCSIAGFEFVHFNVRCSVHKLTLVFTAHYQTIFLLSMIDQVIFNINAVISTKNNKQLV